MMKPFFSLIALLACIQLCAQPTRPGCKNDDIARQVDSIKAVAAKEGFALAKEAAIAMESQYEMPIMLPLNEGAWYRFYFIGDPGSRLFELRMLDADDQQHQYKKKVTGDEEVNVLSFDHIPKSSQFYTIRPVQINKKQKNMCGFVMLFKRIRQ
jgi:hypothetical protein